MNNKFFKISLFIALFIFISSQIGILSPISNFFTWMTSPVFRVSRNIVIKISNNISTIASLGSLAKDNSDLKEKISILEAQNVMYKSEIESQKDLARALNLKEKEGYDLVGVRVVSSDPIKLNQIFIIDRGRSAGLVEGQPAIDSYGNLVGIVTSVFERIAEVTIISDPKIRIPALVLETGAKGHLQGQHALSVSLVDIPQGQELPVGSHIVTTGLLPGVPQGILIGTINSISSLTGDLFQVANVNTASDLRNISILYIIIGSK